LFSAETILEKSNQLVAPPIRQKPVSKAIKPQNLQGRVRRANDEPTTTKDKGKKKAPNPPTSDESDQPRMAKPVTPPPQVDSGISNTPICFIN